MSARRRARCVMEALRPTHVKVRVTVHDAPPHARDRFTFNIEHYPPVVFDDFAALKARILTETVAQCARFLPPNTAVDTASVRPVTIACPFGLQYHTRPLTRLHGVRLQDQATFAAAQALWATGLSAEERAASAHFYLDADVDVRLRSPYATEPDSPYVDRNRTVSDSPFVDRYRTESD